MGCGCDYICRTCKTSYYVGYGSYSTWIHAKTLAEYDGQAKRVMGSDSDDPWIENHWLKKNQNIRRVLQEHDGHDLYEANWDFHDSRGGALTGQFGPMGADVVVIPDYGDYRHVDLYSDDIDRELNAHAGAGDAQADGEC